MEDNKITRINELARKARTVGLTDAEREEQRILRAEYIAAFRKNLTATLENTYVMESDGTKRKLQRKEEN